MGGGSEKAVAEGGNGPTTYGSESGTGRGKDRWKRRPALPEINQGRERSPLHRREYPREEYEWAAQEGRFGRWVWQNMHRTPS